MTNIVNEIQRRIMFFRMSEKMSVGQKTERLIISAYSEILVIQK
jgi:hypothetical protein